MYPPIIFLKSGYWWHICRICFIRNIQIFKGGCFGWLKCVIYGIFMSLAQILIIYRSLLGLYCFWDGWKGYWSLTILLLFFSLFILLFRNLCGWIFLRRQYIQILSVASFYAFQWYLSWYIRKNFWTSTRFKPQIWQSARKSLSNHILIYFYLR